MNAAEKPAAVRVLRTTGWVATIAGLAIAVPSFAIGAANGFDELAKVWVALAAAGVLLVLAGVTALLAGRRTPAGLAFGLVSCTLLLLLLPLGTLLTVVIAIVASQSWPQLREYYGLRRRPA
ncbi:MAG: hypothetical protein E6G68_00175 [Actinobacteria bacterium]|nr:MAG: hypothetical protein E6G68_00175 [Actinomycetota bacterium]